MSAKATARSRTQPKWRRVYSGFATIARLANREDLLAVNAEDPFKSLPASNDADLAPVPPALRR